MIHDVVIPNYNLFITIHANYPKPNLGAFILNLYQVINYHICFKSKFYIINICPRSRFHVSFTYSQLIPNLHMFNSCHFTCMPIYKYTKFHVLLHMSRFMIYMFTKLSSIYIDQVLYPKLHAYHVYTNLPITSSTQITYIKIHIKLHMPIPILAITILMTIPKYPISC